MVVVVPVSGISRGTVARGVVFPGVVAPGARVVPLPGAVVSTGAAARMLLVIDDVQVTRLPPPLPDPLHWLMVTGNAEDTVEGPTVQVTMAPPPLPEPLHWVIVAPDVELDGLHVRLAPPPSAEPMHWLTVAGLVDASPVMLLVTDTVQVTVDPPPLTDPSH